MRFEIRWSNGFWKIFDTKWFRGVRMFGLKVDAEEALKKGEF